MAAALRAAQGSNNGTGGTSVTMTKPTGTADGDVLVMAVTARGGTGTDISTNPMVDLTTANGPDSFAASSDSAKAYVGTLTNITVIQTSDNTITANPTTVGPINSMAMLPNGNYAYYLCSTYSYIGRLATATNTVSGETLITGSPALYSIVSTNDSAFVYFGWDVNNITFGVQKWNASTHAKVLDITFTAAPIKLLLSADGAYIYALTYGGHTTGNVKKIRLSDDTIVASANVGAWSSDMALTPDGNYLWVSYWGGGGTFCHVARVTTSDMSVTAGPDISFGDTASELNAQRCVVSDVGNIVYIVADNQVTTRSKLISISTSSNTVLGSVDWTGAYIYACSIAPGGWDIYVAHSYPNAVVAIKYNGVSWGDAEQIATFGSNPGNAIGILPNGSHIYTMGGQTTTPRVKHQDVHRWSRLDVENSGTTLAQALFWRVAGNDPSSYKVRLSASSLASGEIVALSGASVAVPDVSQYGGLANASSATIAAPAIGSWENSGGVDVGLFGTAYTTNIAPPADYTEPSNGESSSTGGATATTTEGSYRVLTAASVGSIAATGSNAAVNVGHHVFILNGSNFGISASPWVKSIQRGANDTVTINTTTIGTAETVTFSIAGLPANVTYDFNPTTVTSGGGSTLTLTVGGSVAEQTASLTVTGTSASATHNATVLLNVTLVPTPIMVFPLYGSL